MPYAALNPGASYRGLHDSIVNYGGNLPQMMLCQHEETAVQIAHGYAKASGKPMVAILHNLVGLLHANMAVYYAYIDRAPVFIIGATGPMDETKRRPKHRLDPHRAVAGPGGARLHQVGLPADDDRRRSRGLRARLLGDDDRAARPGVHVLRRLAAGEEARPRRCRCRPKGFQTVPSPIAPDPAALAKAADTLAAAKRPVILAEYVGRDPKGFHALVKLAETLGAPVYDLEPAPELSRAAIR